MRHYWETLDGRDMRSMSNDELIAYRDKIQDILDSFNKPIVMDDREPEDSDLVF